MPIFVTKVAKIRKGDCFIADGYHHWTAIEDATDEGAYIVVPVQYQDGGLGQRIWDNPTTEIVVSR